MAKNIDRIVSVRTTIRKSRPLNTRYRLQRLRESAQCMPNSFSLFSITNSKGLKYFAIITRQLILVGIIHMCKKYKIGC